ncbi:hypothetical protein GLOIN_2v1556754 [Rhizophagus irregularis DAOM 181602=DAOM 197198]|nr:hypothetical protein GLOIN_2v1556754 [Rhizophagus irregularis DAOM 181602=DAOM 197198]
MNLKYFEWEDVFEDNFEFNYSRVDPYKEVLLALEKKADILNHLKFYFLYVDHTLQRVLPKLHKLKTLIINDFGRSSDDQLKMLIYNDLETLIIDCILLNAASIIIKNSGGRLKKILLEPYDFSLHDESFTKDSLFFIQEIETNEKVIENGEELLKVLIRSTPINLREIRFSDDFIFSLEALEEFFGKWRGRPLTILTTDSIYEGEHYTKLIDKYKNDGVIKDFRCEPFIDVIYGL